MSYASHNPSARPPCQAVGFRPRPSNGLGIAGLVVSILALIFTCGLLSPVGLLLSLMGLFRRPRGEAIAGTIIGGIGTLAVVAVIGFFVLTGVSVANASRHQRAMAETQQAFAAAEAQIERFRLDYGSLPAGIEGNKLVLQFNDGWDTSLRYEPEQDFYRIRSAGPDREFDTSDDILAGQPIDHSNESDDVHGEIELDFD